MAANKYYSEDELVEKIQSGEYSWLDYVNHHSEEWQNEYQAWCLANEKSISVETAEEFVHYKDEQLEKGDW
jgi:hypothetical protein